MIVLVLDRYFNRVTSFEMGDSNPSRFTVLDDIQTYTITDGVMLSTFTATLSKRWKDSKYINLGSYLVFRDEWDKMWCFTIDEITNETKDTREIYCEDIGLDLLNSNAVTFEANDEQPIEYYLNRELYDTGWTIGINEITTKRKLTFDSGSTTLRRLQDIALAFGCEIYFDIDFNGRSLKKQQVNIVKQIGLKRPKMRLTNGIEVTALSKSINIKELKTAVHAYGANGKDLVDFEYNDGRFRTDYGSNLVVDMEAHEKWNRFPNKSKGDKGYFEMINTAESEDHNDILASAIKALKEKSTPQATYEASIMFPPGKDIHLGDYIQLVDPEFQPELLLESRISSMQISRSNSNNNQVTLSNYRELDSGISDKIRSLQDKQYQIEAAQTTNISIHIHQELQGDKVILEAQVMRGAIDITSEFGDKDFSWKKQTIKGPDEEFNKIHSATGSRIEVDINYVDRTDVFTVQLIVHPFQYVSAKYFQDELRIIANKIEYEREEGAPVVLFATDLHNSLSTALRDNGELLKYAPVHTRNMVELSSMVKLDIMVLGGDIADGSTSKPQQIASLKQIISLAKLANCPTMFCIGNHDTNAWYAKQTGSKNYGMENILTPLELKSIFMDSIRYEKGMKVTDFGCAYIDINNVRHIILNTSDLPYERNNEGNPIYDANNTFGYSGKQCEWLAKTLKETPHDYNVAVYQHTPYGTTHGNINGFNYQVIMNILDAFNRHGAVDMNDTSSDWWGYDIYEDYTTTESKVLYGLHGHLHDDVLALYNGIPFIGTGCNAPFNIDRFYNPELDNRTLQTVNEDLFDVLIFKPSINKIKVLRFGAGWDRTFDMNLVDTNLLTNIDSIPTLVTYPNGVKSVNVDGWQRFVEWEAQEILPEHDVAFGMQPTETITQSIHIRTDGEVERLVYTFYSLNSGHRAVEATLKKINEREYIAYGVFTPNALEELRSIDIYEINISNGTYVEFAYPRIERGNILET